MQVSRVTEATILDDAFERPAGFNLAAFWKGWCIEFENSRIRYLVTTRVSPELVQQLPHYFGEDIPTLIAQASAPDGEGWITLTLPFESLAAARARVLGFGRAIEVLEPQALRKSVIDFAAQITDFYKKK